MQNCNSGAPVTREFDSIREFPFDLLKFDRRNPHEHFYIPADCPDAKKCEDGLCPLAHSKLEKIFHPIVFKTQACQLTKEGTCDFFYKCAFFHNEVDKREAEVAWRWWEQKWDSWRKRIDSILTMHGKNNKELRRKINSILKIRMNKSFNRKDKVEKPSVGTWNVWENYFNTETEPTNTNKVISCNGMPSFNFSFYEPWGKSDYAVNSKEQVQSDSKNENKQNPRQPTSKSSSIINPKHGFYKADTALWSPLDSNFHIDNLDAAQPAATFSCLESLDAFEQQVLDSFNQKQINSQATQMAEFCITDNPNTPDMTHTEASNTNKCDRITLISSVNLLPEIFSQENRSFINQYLNDSRLRTIIDDSTSNTVLTDNNNASCSMCNKNKVHISFLETRLNIATKELAVLKQFILSIYSS